MSRQNLPQLAGSKEALKGAYIISDSKEVPDVIIIASDQSSIRSWCSGRIIKVVLIRVVSMPSMDVFEQQSEEIKKVSYLRM